MALHHLGPFTVDTRALVLLRDGEVTRVPMKTVEVLLALLNRGDDIATKDELMRAAWPDSHPDLEPVLRAIDLEPGFALVHWALGLACDLRGDFTRAQEAHRTAVSLSGGAPALEANLARSLALGGRRPEAEVLTSRLRAERLSPYRLATIEAAMGENESALDSIEQVAHGSGSVARAAVCRSNARCDSKGPSFSGGREGDLAWLSRNRG